MAMSIHGAKILAELIVLYKEGELNRTELENSYKRKWKAKFAARLILGKKGFNPLMGNNRLSSFCRFPA